MNAEAGLIVGLLSEEKTQNDRSPVVLTAIRHGIGQSVELDFGFRPFPHRTLQVALTIGKGNYSIDGSFDGYRQGSVEDLTVLVDKIKSLGVQPRNLVTKDERSLLANGLRWDILPSTLHAFAGSIERTTTFEEALTLRLMAGFDKEEYSRESEKHCRARGGLLLTGFVDQLLPDFLYKMPKEARQEVEEQIIRSSVRNAVTVLLYHKEYVYNNLAVTVLETMNRWQNRFPEVWEEVGYNWGINYSLN